MSELTTAQDREYIRSKWEWFLTRLSEPYEGLPEDKWLAIIPGERFTYDTEGEAVHAAFFFTQEHERQIRQLEEQIYDLNAVIQDLHLRRAAFGDKRQQEDTPQMFARRIIVQGRTLALLQRELKLLKKGMRE